MAASDIGAYDIGVIDVYDGFSLFYAADAERDCGCYREAAAP